MKAAARCFIVMMFAFYFTEPGACQDQKSSGTCSPNVANVRGSVSVTCTEANKRVHIASFDSNVGQDDDKKPTDEETAANTRFSEFLEANVGHIVHLNVSVPCGDSENNCDEHFSWYLAMPSGNSEQYVFIEGDHAFIAIDSGDAGSRVTHYDGFFLIDSVQSGMGGYAQWHLKSLKRETILLSDKYDTD